MRARLAAVCGVATVAATAGVLLTATSASGAKCVGPYTAAGRTVQACVPVLPGCDPRPCDPTAAPPRD